MPPPAPSTELRYPRMTVGVMGSAGGHLDPEVLGRMFRLGQEVARRGHVLITGACPGIPHEAVKGAKSEGGFVVGVSPALNFKEHVGKYTSPTRGYDVMIYTGSGLMGREIENIRSSDVVVFASGRTGTLGEFAIAYDEGKVIGVLEGTGGVTGHIPEIVALVPKKTGATIVSDFDPVRLLDKLEEMYNQRILPEYLAALADADPDGVLEA